MTANLAVLTVHTDELMALGRRFSALIVYRQALAEFEKTDVKAYPIWAGRRVLLRAGEMATGA